MSNAPESGSAEAKNISVEKQKPSTDGGDGWPGRLRVRPRAISVAMVNAVPAQTQP
jgi:hypothetical protein